MRLVPKKKRLKLRPKGPRWKVKLDDCLETMKGLKDNSFDLLCCDPPYGLKFMGKKWDKAIPPIEVWKGCLRILKPGAFGFILCTPRQDCLSRMILNLDEAGFDVGFTPILWCYATGFPKAMNLSKAADKRMGAEREVVGKIHQPPAGGYMEGWQNSPDLTISATQQAKELEGAYAGFQPKPAFEPVIVVMKPLSEKTYLDQALQNKKGCTWLDDGRIPTDQIDLMGNPVARFPANVLVEDDCLNDGIERSSCKSKKFHDAYKGKSNTGMLRGVSHSGNQYGDSGSFSKFFDLDAWYIENIGELPEPVQRTFPFVITPKASKREKNVGLDGMPKKAKPLTGEFKDNPGRKTPKSSPTPRANFHPTVKPIKLMSYLVTIGSRKGDYIIDPYLGSGTTGMSSIGLKRNFFGCELNEEYLEIAKRRIEFVHKNGLDKI